ncbi:carboxymuconolactone decarboxylase family protein [Chelativorans sp. AA-79]|uniref:carboxymuconolactone decarboxylase family protein n=1 Tax=Chelativorans sp. AA-79 TaxID=3028735 RepID=UPI0023F97B94|nr:carboxymuconolactone decarboxylase family protein [Chelativorans sp. AA-79]WEX08720.1 carboxymuconolactone decarboxylase family protein [Chelativorans sp. AA-79]
MAHDHQQDHFPEDETVTARITLPGPESLSPEQRAVFDAVVRGPRGVVVGPLRAAIHSPELADRWQQLGEFLRYRTSLPARLNELAILVTARRWNSELEWSVHVEAARKAGLKEEAIEAIRQGRPPRFADDDESEIYAFARELQLHGQVSEETYRAVSKRWRERGVVELTAVIGYYTMVSMTLNAHRIPLPDGMPPTLSSAGDDVPSTLSALAPLASEGRT